MITFQGISGMNNPDVIVDEIGKQVYAVNVGTSAVTLSVVDGVVIPVTETVETPEEVEPEKEPETVIPDVDQNETPDPIEPEEEHDGEGDSMIEE